MSQFIFPLSYDPNGNIWGVAYIRNCKKKINMQYVVGPISGFLKSLYPEQRRNDIGTISVSLSISDFVPMSFFQYWEKSVKNDIKIMSAPDNVPILVDDIGPILFRIFLLPGYAPFYFRKSLPKLIFSVNFI